MSSSDALLYSVAGSNMPAERKTAFRRWYERIMGVPQGSVYSQALGHARETVSVIRQGGESGIAGGILGFVDGEFGLDAKIAGHNVPLDGIGAAVGLAAAIALANDGSGMATDARNLGSACLTVLTYRKMKEWREDVHSEEKKKTTAAHGADPILSLAKEFDL